MRLVVALQALVLLKPLCLDLLLAHDQVFCLLGRQSPSLDRLRSLEIDALLPLHVVKKLVFHISVGNF